MSSLLPSSPIQNDIDVIALYRKYHDELYALGCLLRPICDRMNRQGYGTTFGDFDGELMYMLVREQRPAVVWEISPNAGWSTNYLLAAVTKNGNGTLHSFDIITQINGRPLPEIIRSNQSSASDPKRHLIHIGDAMMTTEEVAETPQFLLIDSCHDAGFAQWYTQKVFPRVLGTIFVQDIANHDRMESSTESQYLWKWLKNERITFSLVGQSEQLARAKGVRDDLPIRRMLRSNCILLSYPYVHGDSPNIGHGPDSFLKEAKEAIGRGERQTADQLLIKTVNILATDVIRVNRHRFLMKAAELYTTLGNVCEANRCRHMALGLTVASDLKQRIKGMPELAVFFIRQRRPHFLLKTLCIILVEPRLWSRTVIACFKLFTDVLRSRRVTS